MDNEKKKYQPAPESFKDMILGWFEDWLEDSRLTPDILVKVRDMIDERMAALSERRE